MSLEAITWALHLPLDNPAQKLTLIGVANHANPATGLAWPSEKLMATYAGRSTRQVRRYLDDLTDAGHLTRVRRRRRKNGTLGTWIYRVNLPGNVDEDDLEDLEDDELDGHRTPPDTQTSGGEPPPADTQVSGRPPDTQMSAHELSSLNPRTTTTGGGDDDQKPDDDGRFPTLTDVTPGAAYTFLVTRWARDNDEDLHSRIQHAPNLDGAYLAMLKAVTAHDPPLREHCERRVIQDYLFRSTGDDDWKPTHGGHLGRLHATHGPLTAMRLVTEAVTWGAGLPTDDDHQAGYTGILRYATAIANRERKENR